ncbi:pectate trisaccharide-lyase [Uliginosibacterium flavum]
MKVSNLTDLKTLTDSNEKLIVLINGVIDMQGMVPLRSDKTIVGLPGSKLTNGGFEIYKRQNIIIRNVYFEGAPDDTLKINQNTHHVWVDHCTFSDGDVYPDGKEHDGLFDITRQTSHITISYSHFKNHSKTMLIGHSDGASTDAGFLKTSIHHNWFQTDQRHPRVRFGEVHVYNNFYDGNKIYGIASTMEADVLVEGNYFKNVLYPAYVGYAESGPGDLVQRNNILDGSGGLQTRGSAFDPASYYVYAVENPAGIPVKVMANAGFGKIDPWAAAGVAPF